MRAGWSAGACVAAVLILGGFHRAARQTNGRLWGRVLDDSGRPVARAEVRLSDEANPQSMLATLSGANGSYAFDGLETGNYYVSADALAHIADRSGPFNVPQDSGAEQDIHLQKMEYAGTGALLHLDQQRAPRQLAAAKALGDQRQVLLLGIFLEAANSTYAADVSEAQGQIGKSAVIAGKVSVANSPGTAPPGQSKLEIVNLLTGDRQTVPLDTKGRYSVKVLPVGTYRVQAMFTGFGETAESGIKVKPNSKVTVNLQVNAGKGPGGE